MTAGSKTISNNQRPKIDTIKCMIKYAQNPFDGDRWTKTAISELRKEGVNIVYDKAKCRYYNADTIHPKWGY